MTLSSAYSLLAVDAATCTLEELKKRWHELATHHHPDKGGDAWKFVELARAHAMVKRDLETPKMCWDCNGRGRRTEVAVGVGVTTGLCTTCKGLGRISRG